MNKTDMLQDKVNQLFEEQLSNWLLAKNNYRVLELVKVKTLTVNTCRFLVQFNPMRFITSAAHVDPKSISERPCFLCSANRPIDQKSIIFNKDYQILINPYPIFPLHLTIPTIEHTDQLIASRYSDMLDLACQLNNFVVFYNGPKAGASAPDHFHFQAGNKGFLPIETHRNWNNAVHIKSDNKLQMIYRFEQFYHSLHIPTGEDEPKLNILTWYENQNWTTYIFSRKKHRPVCFFAEGDANMLISPGTVDLSGVFITPLEKDFEKITGTDIETILNEVCF